MKIYITGKKNPKTKQNKNCSLNVLLMQQNFEKQVVSNVSQKNVSRMGLLGLALHPAPLPPSAVCPFSHMSQARVVAPAWLLRVLPCVPLSPSPCGVPLPSLSSFLKACTFSLTSDCLCPSPYALIPTLDFIACLLLSPSSGEISLPCGFYDISEGKP